VPVYCFRVAASQNLFQLQNKRSPDDLLREQLLKSAGVDDQFDAMARSQQPLFAAPVMVPTMADFAGITAAIAALPGAVAAVVPGAVAAAMAPVAARVDNIRIRSYNKRQRTIHQAHGVPSPCRCLLKV
jgi:hypothetical protein